MTISFEGKVVLITGATDGIGLAIARAFGKDGAAVAICGRSADKLAKAVASLEEEGIKVYGATCDVTKAADIEAFAEGTVESLGKIDIFINNAGYFPFCQFKDMSEEMWDRTIDTNLKSTFLGAKVAYEKMKDHGGVLINASSFASKFNGVGYGAYAASKWGVNVLTRTLAAELAPYGIRVFAYAPGFIETALTQEMLHNHGQEGILAPIALRRVGQPEDIANVVEFMASDLGGYVSGTVVEIDGGKFCVQNPQLAWQTKEEN